MARAKNITSDFVCFNIVYDDGSLSSNRKVPRDKLGGLGGLDGDEPAREIIEAQDEKIAQMSGRPRKEIKSISRSPGF